MERIYVDHAATSPVREEVVTAMIPYMTTLFGNPSSIHAYGREARHALDGVRRVCAKSIGALPNEIIFTSGGTESDNLAVRGVAYANQNRGKHIITTEIEHHAILHTCQQLEKEGFEVTYLPVNQEGRISIEDLKAALRDDTILVSVMFGNNEVGTIQPIEEIGHILKEHQAVFHSDGVQAYGLMDINVNQLGLDLFSISGHKINGPKGIGFLYVRQSVNLASQQYGGEQERKRRAGTENVAGAIGLKVAIELMMAEREERVHQYNAFKERMLTLLTQSEIAFSVNSPTNDCLPHVMNIFFEGTDVERMLVSLDLVGIAASSGSACTAGSFDPSHVLVAMFGKDSERGRGSIRFSFGYGNTIEQIEKVASETIKIVERLKNR
ncbi:MAG: cysteine desulfurase family protein [Bacillaceae bacterium]